jgi:hypothetical protein
VGDMLELYEYGTTASTAFVPPADLTPKLPARVCLFNREINRDTSRAGISKLKGLVR